MKLAYSAEQAEIFFGEVRRYNSVAKGRRFGVTRGAAHACIEWCLEGLPILWGDTVSTNIKKYVERYFEPALKENELEYDWNSTDKVLKVGAGWIDFRSADRPENWEGFGYKRIVLNEAGIILSDDYLYTNAVVPMMADFPDAQLFALGVPKGKRLKNGQDHPFYLLHSTVSPQHRSLTFTTEDNPFLDPVGVQAVKEEILRTSPEQLRQEFYGEFIERTSGSPFAFAYDAPKHRQLCERRPTDTHFFAIDFNVEPFSGIAAHIWQDATGPHFHTFAAAKLPQASIRAMAEWILDVCPMRHLIRLTGDRGGMSRGIGTMGPIRLFEELRKELKISAAQIAVPPNPTHLKSREDSNLVLAVHPDCRIDPGCTRLHADMQTVEVDGEGKIVKADRTKVAQQADELDCWRYLVNVFLRPWIDQHRRKR